MLKSRVELERKLQTILEETPITKTIKNDVVEQISTAHNFTPGDIHSVFNGTTHISTISQVFLYLFAKYLYEKINEESINPNSFFTETDIKEGNKFKLAKKDREKFPLIIADVIKIAPDHFITKMTIQQVVEIYNKLIIKYNYETQRQAKLKEYNDRIIQTPDINENSVREIKKLILQNDFITNVITFNILQNGEEDFVYDEKSGELIIKSGEINILDGFHRSLGMVFAILENPEINYVTGVNITNFDVDKGRRFIVQEDKKNKINKKYIKSIDVDNISNRIVNKLNEDSRSYLKNKITVNNNILKNSSMIDYTVLSEAIQHEFEPQETKDIIKYSRMIINGMNYIVESNPDLIENHQPNTLWIALIALIKRANDAEDWQEKTNKILDKIDYTQFIEEKNINKSVIKKIAEYIETIKGDDVK